MRDLEFKDLAPYLPYKLKGQLTHDLRDDFRDSDWVKDVEIFMLELQKKLKP